MMENKIYRPAVFLDRDGVLNEERSYVKSFEDLIIFPYAKECISEIHKRKYWAIVLSNQSGIARGFVEESSVKLMNKYLQEMTGVDAVYYCPHHPDGLIPQYTGVCDCRKPKTGLIQQACDDFNIDLDASVMIGDRASDIQMGNNVGIRTILLESGYGTERLEYKVTPNHVCKDLKEAICLL